MIARILYRNTVHGVIKYVFGKPKLRVLGFQNTYSETDTTPVQFSRILHHLGGRHGSQKRYVHFSLNLPHGEKLSDRNFYQLAKNYMENMGYGEQPFAVVQHFDTQHQHVHIVSTTVQENGNLIDLSHDFRRNLATQKYLEKQFGLAPSPEARSNRELPLYRLPEIKQDDANGVRFYIQDILNSTLQKYKVRSFRELSALVAPYHIRVKPVKNKNGRVAVSYGIDIDNGYKSRFIDGYTVHPRLSGPKLQAVFDRQSRAKLLPMHKKRLEKQLLTTLALFKSITPEDLPAVLRSYQNINAQIKDNKKGTAPDFMILDKSGYVFGSAEISPDISFGVHPVLVTNETNVKSVLNFESKQLVLEIRKVINNAFHDSYRNGYKKGLLSEYVLTKKRSELLSMMLSSERYTFLHSYTQKDERVLKSMLLSAFEQTKTDIHVNEIRREKAVLEQKALLIKAVLDGKVFDMDAEKAMPFELVQSLGLMYVSGTLSYLNSNRHQVPLRLSNFVLPQSSSSYISTGFMDQNEKILRALVHDIPFKETGLSGSSFFLPIIFPSLFKAMSDEHRQKFEQLSLMAYQKTAEKQHMPFEKSAKDYVHLFNEKGFYFVRKEGNIFLHSIYSMFPQGVPLLPKTKMYLRSQKRLDEMFGNQKVILDRITEKGQRHLENLWVSYLIEKQQYHKAAFMIAKEGIRPNLAPEVLNFHLENGLREKIATATKLKIDSNRARILRKSIYAFSSFLGKSTYREEKVFNAFRDELTDYGKYRNALF